MRKIWKLHENIIGSDFLNQANKFQECNETDPFVEDYCKVSKGALLEGSGRTCGETKGQASCIETWWSDDTNNIVK